MTARLPVAAPGPRACGERCAVRPDAPACSASAGSGAASGCGQKSAAMRCRTAFQIGTVRVVAESPQDVQPRLNPAAAGVIVGKGDQPAARETAPVLDLDRLALLRVGDVDVRGALPTRADLRTRSWEASCAISPMSTGVLATVGRSSCCGGRATTQASIASTDFIGRKGSPSASAAGRNTRRARVVGRQV
jgi:hypothetical protein